MQEDVGNLKHVNSEPSEHIFGMLRYEKREFTVSEMCDLVENLRRKLNAIYDSDLKHSQDPKKGYQATLNDFIAATEEIQTATTGSFKITDDALLDGIALGMWNNGGLPPLLRSVSSNMKSFLSKVRCF
jgi:hypothetical protein